MDTNSIEEIRAILRTLINQTRENLIEWVRVNPTTFSWVNGKGRVTVQFVETKKTAMRGGRIFTESSKNYIFQASDPAGRTRMTVNSADVVSLDSDLDELFSVAVESITSRGLGFLKDMMS